jgi:hypothetical protein
VPTPIIGLGIAGIHSEDLQTANQGFVSIVSVDNGSAAAGQTITSGQTTQGTGYQLRAADTWFSNVVPATTGNGLTPTAAAVLPLVGSLTSPKCLVGAKFQVINTGAYPINVYPNAGDSGNSINAQASNLPVVLGVNTITPFECVAPGIWFADGIGQGAMGSISTIISQGNITAAGTNQGTATAITQAMANVATVGSGTGVVLPAAKAGAQITVANNGSNNLQVYGNGSDTINGTAGSTGVVQVDGSTFTPPQVAQVTIYYCFTTGAWVTK